MIETRYSCSTMQLGYGRKESRFLMHALEVGNQTIVVFYESDQLN
jgi:hypothetical protein